MQPDTAVGFRSAKRPDTGVEEGAVVDRLPRASVDVVIPMRDGAATILTALASVLAQTSAPRRIFIVDDGSTDGGSRLIRSRQFPSVTVIETPACGVSHARNVGIAQSRADFIAFLDCDDLWAPDKLERQLAVVRNNRDVAVVTCGSISFDMQHRPIAGTCYSPELRGHVFENTLKQGFIRGGLSSNMVVRRSALLEVGGFDETMAFGEDVDLWLRLAETYVFDYCRAPLAYIVENLASTTRRPSTAARRQEILLQPLCCLEKWVEDRSSSRWLLAFAARLILTYTIRERLTTQGVWELREAIVLRAPKIGHRIARTRAHLIAAAILAGVVYLPSIWHTWRLRRRRLISSARLRS
jgi:glycosyltransferase involved in cell wall biosynthesis